MDKRLGEEGEEGASSIYSLLLLSIVFVGIIRKSALIIISQSQPRGWMDRGVREGGREGQQS